MSGYDLVNGAIKEDIDRYVKLSDYTLCVLRKYWRLHHNPRFIFPAGKTYEERHQATKPMDRGGVQKALKAIVSSTSIRKSISCHSFRHCYGAHLVEEGLNLRAIQNELGHTCPKTTALYTQLTETTQQNTHAYINSMVNRFLLALKNKKGVSDATLLTCLALPTRATGALWISNNRGTTVGIGRYYGMPY